MAPLIATAQPIRCNRLAPPPIVPSSTADRTAMLDSRALRYRYLRSRALSTVQTWPFSTSTGRKRAL